MNATRNAQVAEMCRGDRSDFREEENEGGARQSRVPLERQGRYDIWGTGGAATWADHRTDRCHRSTERSAVGDSV
jgi:hypothetical protein